MTAARILGAARQASVLVVGDICLDRWCVYDPALSEASRETGIPRCAVVSTRTTPGAGGTVAANLASLGAGRVSVLGAVGRDGFAHELRQALQRRGIEGDRLVRSARLQTFTYTKLLRAGSGVEDLPRVDFVNAEPAPRSVERRILKRFTAGAGDFDAVVVADQAETDEGGVVTPAVRDAVATAARERPDGVFVADSRERIEHFRGVIAVPNEGEARRACRRAFGRESLAELHRRIAGPALVVTAGARGARLVDGAGERWIPAVSLGTAIDVCGAGDSLAAGLTLGLVAGASVETALRFGIIVAGVTVRKPGTGCASPEEVLAAERGELGGS